MRSTFGGLEIGKRGLFAQQSALNTTGHNIANANTPGYSRQRVVLEASRPYPYPGLGANKPAQVGTGVDVVEITRLRNQFLDRQYRNENKYLGYYESRSETYSKIEVVFKDTSDGLGLQAAMDKFWGAWHDLASSAESGEVRKEVIGYAEGLNDVLEHISQSLKQYQDDLNNVVQVTVNDINSIATRIRDLNAQIARITPHGYTTNDLNDQRDLLLDELSKLVDVQVTQGPNGTINVSIGNGHALVTGTTLNELTVSQNPASGLFDVSIGGSPLTLTSGKLLEVIESRGITLPDGSVTGIIPDMLKKMDSLATVLTREVNQLQRTGKNLVDIRNNTDTQVPFFISKSWYNSLPNKDLTLIDFTSIPAADLDPKGADDVMVNPLIVDNPDYIAAAGNPATGPADGSNAQKIADIRSQIITSGFPNQTTIDGFYASIIGDLGVDAERAENLFLTKQNLVSHVDNKRISISGVNLDEEMTEMIRFQHAYAAAARTITTMDEMLNKIINGMGLVGR